MRAILIIIKEKNFLSDKICHNRIQTDDRMLIFQKNILPDRPVDKQKVAENVEEWLQKQGIREEDEISMCELFDQYERKGREEGKQEGIEAGRREGRNEGIKCGEARRLVADIESAMQFFQVTLEKACEGLGTTVGGYEEAKKLLL